MGNFFGYIFNFITVRAVRRSYASAVLGVVILSVRLSICLSVRPSHACFVTNPKNLPVMFYTIYVCMYVSFGQGSSLLWTHTLRPFYSRTIALTQEGRSLANDVCECVRD